MCVCCHPIYSGRQTCGHTSRGHTGGRSHRRKVTQEEGHTGFLHFRSAVLPLIFVARIIQLPLSLVDREVEFCVLTIQCSLLVRHFIFISYFLGGKILVRVTASRFDLTSQRQKVSKLLTEQPPGWQVSKIYISICPLHTISGCGQERRILFGPW